MKESYMIKDQVKGYSECYPIKHCILTQYAVDCQLKMSQIRTVTPDYTVFMTEIFFNSLQEIEYFQNIYPNLFAPY